MSKKAFGNAVVIGSGIAGLTAARVLANTFSRITIIDRDRIPDESEYRRGVPQARHAHTLMPRGQAILEELFPGLSDELLTKGAIAVDPSRDIAYYDDGVWHTPRGGVTETSVICSRPLLETTIYHRVAALPGVEVREGCETVGLLTDEQRTHVAGVVLRDRRDANPSATNLAADLVIDASGRSSRAPQWLESLGYTPPEEWKINPFVGYATAIFRRPEEHSGGWKLLYVRPTPPDGTRGGMILPAEAGAWHVTLVGVAGDYPPTDEEGFMEFARSLPTQRLYEAIRHAEVLVRPSGFRLTENRVRRYDRLSRYLEGFLVYGDAAYALNPIYAQGMTAAALGSQVLARCLQAQRRHSSLVGLAAAFQKQLSRTVGNLWRLATTKDWHWPFTEITDDADQKPRPEQGAFRARLASISPQDSTAEG